VVKTVFCRKSSSETLISWKSGKTIYKYPSVGPNRGSTAMASDEGTGRFGGGAMHLQLNKKVMFVLKALLVLLMLEKYKNVDKEG
jgi:hypothetical protein